MKKAVNLTETESIQDELDGVKKIKISKQSSLSMSCDTTSVSLKSVLGV